MSERLWSPKKVNDALKVALSNEVRLSPATVINLSLLVEEIIQDYDKELKASTKWIVLGEGNVVESETHVIGVTDEGKTLVIGKREAPEKVPWPEGVRLCVDADTLKR